MPRESVNEACAFAPLCRFWVLGFVLRRGPGFGFWAAPQPGFWVLGLVPKPTQGGQCLRFCSGRRCVEIRSPLQRHPRLQKKRSHSKRSHSLRPRRPTLIRMASPTRVDLAMLANLMPEEHDYLLNLSRIGTAFGVAGHPHTDSDVQNMLKDLKQTSLGEPMIDFLTKMSQGEDATFSRIVSQLSLPGIHYKQGSCIFKLTNPIDKPTWKQLIDSTVVEFEYTPTDVNVPRTATASSSGSSSTAVSAASTVIGNMSADKGKKRARASDDEDFKERLKMLRKETLVKIAEDQRVSKWGTKEDIIDRIVNSE